MLKLPLYYFSIENVTLLGIPLSVMLLFAYPSKLAALTLIILLLEMLKCSKKKFFLKEDTSFLEMFKNIQIFNMEFSKLINYLTENC